MKEKTGYAMTIGTNKFLPRNVYNPEKGNSSLINLPDLKFAEKSSKEFAQILAYDTIKNDYSYKYIIALQNKEATLVNTIKGLLYLASKALPGDTVSISFSLHGDREKCSTDSPDLNFMYLYDSQFSETQLCAILKFFNSEVNINLAFDMCHSGTWLDKFASNSDDTIAALSDLSLILKDKDSVLSDFLQKNKNDISEIQFLNNCMIYNGIYDNTTMLDKYNSISMLLNLVSLRNSLLKPKSAEKLLYKAYQEVYSSEKIWPFIFKKYYNELKVNKKTDEEIIEEEFYPFDLDNELHQKIIAGNASSFSFTGPKTDGLLSKNIFSIN